MIAIALMLAGQLLAADTEPLPAVSPSIEADADYLLTTTDFSTAQYGMAAERVRQNRGDVLVRTTGAQFLFEPGSDRLTVKQRLGRAREAAVVSFPRGALAGLAVTRETDGYALLESGGLTMRINGDSLLMLRCERPLTLTTAPGFAPLSVRQSQGNLLLLDEFGALGCYLATGTGEGSVPADNGTIATTLAAEQVFWLAVGPPRPYPWEESLGDRVCWHWSMETGYPSDRQIEEWSRYGNILLQQSEVMLWKDWSLRFLPRQGVGEFERVNATCERLGMRNMVYTSPYYFLTSTGFEDKAMNSFDNFAVTGFSPGDGRGLNWPVFVSEIAKVMREYRPDGLYFDGIYDNVVRTYIVARKAREIVGDGGLLEYHATGSPPGGGVYLPQIDTYFNYILRGEGCEAQYANADYMRYFVSTYNISNSVGVLCNNNNYPLDEAFVGKLLDDNIRLHYLLGGPDDQRTQGMERAYWPALDESLRPRVERAAEAREAAAPRVWELLSRAKAAATASYPALYEADFAGEGYAVEARPGAASSPELPDGWGAYLSPNSAATVAADEGILSITACGNTIARLERDLPEGSVGIACRVRASGECGQSWGPALVLRVGTACYRIGLRSDGRAQVDRGGSQVLFEGYPLGEWYWLRVRVAEGCLLYETSRDGARWECLQADYVGALEGPMSLQVGKTPYDGSQTEYQVVGEPGGCEISDVLALGAARK